MADIVEVFKTTVNFVHTIAEMVAAGRYHLVDKGITDELFPRERDDPDGEADVVYETLGLDGPASLEDAWAEMDRRGLQRPTARKTLIYFEKNLKVKRRHPIVGAASAPDELGRVSVLAFYADTNSRSLRLYLRKPIRQLHGGCLFLAVRPSK